MTDEEIVKAVLTGEIESFEQIMRRYNEQFYRIGMAYLKDPIETEDAMQSTYLKIFENLPGFKGKSSFSTWAIRILINECKMMLRKKRNAFAFLFHISNNLRLKMANPSSDSRLITKELKAFIEKAILELPAKYRTVFMLREVNGYSVKETARILDMSESNVKVRLHRAKEQVKSKMLKANKSQALFDYTRERCDPFRAKIMTLICRQVG